MLGLLKNKKKEKKKKKKKEEECQIAIFLLRTIVNCAIIAMLYTQWRSQWRAKRAFVPPFFSKILISLALYYSHSGLISSVYYSVLLLAVVFQLYVQFREVQK